MKEKQVKNKKRVGILRGGEGDNYLNSLQMGGNIISHILEHLFDKFKTIDILVDRDGKWHADGLPINPSQLIHKVDVVWNVAHPNLSLIVEKFSIPTIGISSFFSTIASNRALLKKHIKDNLDINMPQHLVLPLYQEDFDGPREDYAEKKAKEIFEKITPPWIVRSLTENNNTGIHVAKTLLELKNAIEDEVNHKKSILVEELIPGKVVSVHSIRGFRGKDVYTLPIENLSSIEKEKIISLAEKLHEHFDNQVYLKSNFLLTSRGSVFLTGVLFNPNIKKDSHLSLSCESVGAKVHHVVEHILERALI